MTGVREQVWRWDEANFSFKDTGERLNDFLPALEIKKVTASSAWIDPTVLKELKANALNDALNKSDESAVAGPKDGKEGATGGDLELGLEDLEKPTSTSTTKAVKPKGSKKPAKDKEPPPPAEPEIEIDRSKFMAFGADKNLATAWIEDDDKSDGKGQWIEVELEEESAVKMVRVVAGCVDTNQSFRSHNIPESFLVQLDGGSEARIDRRDPGKFDNPSIAFSDALFKSKERPWMKTTLVFFEGKQTAKKVRITLDKAIKSGKSNQTCISEISVH